MLKDRILLTLKFFDLQDYPLTVLELQSFLLPEFLELKNLIDENWEIKDNLKISQKIQKVLLIEIVNCLDTECAFEAENYRGFYFLRGRTQIAEERWKNYLFAIFREKRINRFIKFVKFLPFIWGVAVGGSQAMGHQNKSSDIDLFVITDSGFLGMARIFLTAFFQVFGVRRHDKKIANRFCLNHYLGEGNVSSAGRDMYNAMEYLRLRPIVYEMNVSKFLAGEFEWVKNYFPNFQVFNIDSSERQPFVQKWFEQIFRNKIGRKIEDFLCSWQLIKICQGNNFVVATAKEMAFHSLERKQELLKTFFEI